MILTTCETVPGRTVAAHLGLVRGNTIRARHIGRDILAILRTIIGGEVTDYTKAMGEAREQALDRMIAEARSMDADAIICLRFMSTEMLQGSAEFLVYGTAVRLE